MRKSCDSVNQNCIMPLTTYSSSFLRCGTNYESADEALESAATNVNIHSQWSVDAKTTRGCKRDVYKVLRGPGGSDPEHRGAIQ